MLEQEALERRRGFIGGTDVAAIMGISKYKTPYDIFYDKNVGRRNYDNKFMLAGRMLEPAVANMFIHVNGGNLIQPNNPYIHKDWEHQGASIDFLYEQDNKIHVLEVKTSRHSFKDLVPTEYVCQCQHYMDVLDIDTCFLVVLVAGLDLEIYPLQRDKDFIDIKNSIVNNFWNEHIIKNVPPPPKNSYDLETYFDIKQSFVELTDINLIKEIKSLRKTIKELTEQEDAIKEKLKMTINDGAGLTFNGDIVVTWYKAKEQSKFDIDTFKKENKELYNKYLLKTEGSRRLLIK